MHHDLSHGLGMSLPAGRISVRPVQEVELRVSENVWLRFRSEPDPDDSTRCIVCVYVITHTTCSESDDDVQTWRMLDALNEPARKRLDKVARRWLAVSGLA